MAKWADVVWQNHHMKPTDFAALSNKERNFIIASEQKAQEDKERSWKNG